MAWSSSTRPRPSSGHGVEEGLDVKAIAERLVAEYDVETGRALADVEALLARMREQGFVED